MLSDTAKKIELKFWDVIIPLLSKADWLNKIITSISDLYHEHKIIKQAAIVILIAFAGFACGFIVFSLSSLLS
jgi:hypothetical protein